MISGVTDIIQEWRVCLKLSMEFRFIKILSMDKRFAEKILPEMVVNVFFKISIARFYSYV